MPVLALSGGESVGGVALARFRDAVVGFDFLYFDCLDWICAGTSAVVVDHARFWFGLWLTPCGLV